METKRVIFVSIAYRLGPLGFLSTGDKEISGNFGFKDQALGLKWVYDNIAAFGGDPKQITIYGNSAGAASCQIHMLNKETSKLFNRVILSSGSIFGKWAYIEKNPLRLAVQLTEKAGFSDASTYNTSKLASTLRSLDYYTIIQANNDMKVTGIINPY